MRCRLRLRRSNLPYLPRHPPTPHIPCPCPCPCPFPPVCAADTVRIAPSLCLFPDPGGTSSLVWCGPAFHSANTNAFPLSLPPLPLTPFLLKQSHKSNESPESVPISLSCGVPTSSTTAWCLVPIYLHHIHCWVFLPEFPNQAFADSSADPRRRRAIVGALQLVECS